jgi:hypothetical protein
MFFVKFLQSMSVFFFFLFFFLGTKHVSFIDISSINHGVY